MTLPAVSKLHGLCTTTSPGATLRFRATLRSRSRLQRQSPSLCSRRTLCEHNRLQRHNRLWDIVEPTAHCVGEICDDTPRDIALRL